MNDEDMLRNAVKSRARELLEEINHEEGGGELELVLMASILKEVSAEMVREVGREAREAGATWVEIAYVLGYTSSSSAIQLIDERTRAAAKAGRRIRGGPVRISPPPPGLSVAEAAELAGINRRTAYDWIRKGWFEVVKDDRGRNRVVGGHPETDETLARLGRAQRQVPAVLTET